MSLFSKLFDKGEVPLPVIEEPMLGLLKWSKDDEAWIGTYNRFRFAISYERKAAPTSRLLSYVKDVLGDPELLLSTLESEKRKWASRVPPAIRDEVAQLKFGLVHFSLHKDRGYIIADVEGGGDERSWRIEYHDRTCDGLGFDT